MTDYKTIKYSVRDRIAYLEELRTRLSTKS